MLAGENQEMGEMGENGRNPTKWVYKETRSHIAYFRSVIWVFPPVSDIGNWTIFYTADKIFSHFRNTIAMSFDNRFIFSIFTFAYVRLFDRSEKTTTLLSQKDKVRRRMKISQYVPVRTKGREWGQNFKIFA